MFLVSKPVNHRPICLNDVVVVVENKNKIAKCVCKYAEILLQIGKVFLGLLLLGDVVAGA